MSNISSNSLFHFTPKKQHLINILKNTFIPRYCLENVPLSITVLNGNFEAAVPMICFCDISLSQIENHIKTYGKYGIGLTKEWGIRNNLNPIIYTNPDSNFTSSIYKMATDVHNALGENCNNTSKSICDEYMNILNFLKPYKGDLVRGKKTIKGVTFYNEREWRYVPKIPIESKYENSLSKTDYLNKDLLFNESKKMIDFRLTFEPRDIKYIFVKSESEIHKMVQELRDIKVRFSSREIDILTSKILTTDQIKEDF